MTVEIEVAALFTIAEVRGVEIAAWRKTFGAPRQQAVIDGRIVTNPGRFFEGVFLDIVFESGPVYERGTETDSPFT